MTKNGFSLIELMIIIAIIGMLILIAQPLYRDYIMRAYIAEALNLTITAKSAVVNHYAVEGKLPVVDLSIVPLTPINNELGLGPSISYATKTIESMSVYVYGATNESHIEIGVHFKEPIFPKRSVLYLIGTIKNDSIIWTCSIQYYGTAIRPAWVPSVCRFL